MLNTLNGQTYFLIGFLDKNNDLLYRNLKELMSGSTNPIIMELFTKDELSRYLK